MGLLRRRRANDAVVTDRAVDARPVDVVETRADRLALAEDGGLGTVSTASVIAGSLVALAVTAILLGAAVGLVRAMAGGTDVPRSVRSWGIGGAVWTVFSVWVGFMFGGYTAGRMARRAGGTNGFLVCLTTFLAALTGLAVWVSWGDDGVISTTLHNAGVRNTTGWMTVGVVTAACCLAIMALASTLGGVMGERWHTVLVERALSGRARPAADDGFVDLREDRRREVRARDDEVVKDDVTTADAESRHDVLPQGRR